MTESLVKMTRASKVEASNAKRLVGGSPPSLHNTCQSAHTMCYSPRADGAADRFSM